MNRIVQFSQFLQSLLRWYLSIGKKFIRIAPGLTFFIVIFSLISQLSLIVAFLLPLKVIILLGSSSVPSYFPISLQEIGRNHLVAGFSASALGFYILHLLSNKVTVYNATRGSREIIEKSNKLILFSNQREITVTAYQRYSASLSGFLFSAISLVIILLIYPTVSIIVFICAFAILITLSILAFLGESIKAKLHDVSSVLSSVGFLLVFSVMIMDFIIEPSPEVTIALICILLVRQIMNQLSSSMLTVLSLYSQRHQINYIFFHGHKLIEKESDKEERFWSLLAPKNRAEWLPKIMENMTGNAYADIESDWVQSGIQNLIIFSIKAIDINKVTTEQYLIKLYNSSMQVYALKEANLLTRANHNNLPALKFLGVTNLEDYQCHLFLLQGETKIGRSENDKKQIELLEKLIAYEPELSLVKQHKRSKPILHERLNRNMIDRLRLITLNADQHQQLLELEKELPQILRLISLVPVQLINSNLPPDGLWYGKDGDLKALHWGGWCIDTVGVNWPHSEQGLNDLADALKKAIPYRKCLSNVNEEGIKLVALMSIFERHFYRQEYMNIFSLLPRIHALVNIENLKG